MPKNKSYSDYSTSISDDDSCVCYKHKSSKVCNKCRCNRCSGYESEQSSLKCKKCEIEKCKSYKKNSKEKKPVLENNMECKKGQCIIIKIN